MTTQEAEKLRKRYYYRVRSIDEKVLCSRYFEDEMVTSLWLERVWQGRMLYGSRVSGVNQLMTQVRRSEMTLEDDLSCIVGPGVSAAWGGMQILYRIAAKVAREVFHSPKVIWLQTTSCISVFPVSLYSSFVCVRNTCCYLNFLLKR